MVKSSPSKPVTGESDKRTRRALVGKSSTRTRLKRRRGKSAPHPNLSKCKLKASSAHMDLSAGNDTESGDNNLDDRTCQLVAAPSIARVHQTGAHDDPYIIGSGDNSETEKRTRPRLETKRSRFAADIDNPHKHEKQERYSIWRKPMQSLYCAPTSRRPSKIIKQVQDFMEDVAGDAESVETFDGTDIDSESDGTDVDTEELKEEVKELNIDTYEWDKNTKTSHACRIGCSPDADVDIDTQVDGSEQRQPLTKKPQRGRRPTSSGTKSIAKRVLFDLWSQSEEDDEDEFFVKFAAKRRNISVHSSSIN